MNYYEKLRHDAEKEVEKKKDCYGGVCATPEEHRKELLKFAEKELQSLKADLALEKSITKWYAIVNGTGKDFGGRNCALCLLHKRDSGQGILYSCKPCVVAEKSMVNGCAGTPYTEWIHHHDQKHAKSIDEGRSIECPECIELALKELNFLLGLRPAQYIRPPAPRFRADGYGAIRRRPFNFSPIHTTD